MRRSRNKNARVLGVSSNMKSLSPGMTAGVAVDAGAGIKEWDRVPEGWCTVREASRWYGRRDMLCFSVRAVGGGGGGNSLKAAVRRTSE